MMGGSVAGGSGANSGQAFGTGIFLQGDEQITLSAAAGTTLAISDVIADQLGVGGTAGKGSLVIQGPGTVDLKASNSFVGGVDIDSGTLEIGAHYAAGSGVITFEAAPVDPTLLIDAADTPAPGGTFETTIAEFGDGDAIDIRGLAFTNGATAKLSGDNKLEVTSNGETVNFTVSDPLSSTYYAHTDGSGGTLVTDSATLCFMPGTRISTPEGEVAVETLKRGDLVTTHLGEAKPVTWVGRQTVARRFSTPLRNWPVRVKAAALGPQTPVRDLLVSPDHALWIDGVLIQAGALVNGTSVVRETIVPEAWTYYHIELDDHSLILAEGAPAESFVDNIDRLHFDNWAEHEALFPDGKPVNELPYPRAKSHRQIPVEVRVRMAERALEIADAETGAKVA